MKSALIVALAVALAAPVAVTSIPSAAETQVLAGANAARRSQLRRTGLSERDTERLYEAQDEVAERETAISTLNAVTESGRALTTQQVEQLADHQRRLENAQRTVDRLEAKRERLGG